MGPLIYDAVQLLIEQRNYSNLTTYVFKADAALDASAAANNNNLDPPISTVAQLSSSSAPTKKKTAERDSIQSKLDLAGALSFLGQGSYAKAAHAFLKIGTAKELGDWVGKVSQRFLFFHSYSYANLFYKLIAVGDIAVYGTLCALATFPRSTIKSKIVENPFFGVFIEQEPHIRELIESYISSNFKNVLEVLDHYSVYIFPDFDLSSVAYMPVDKTLSGRSPLPPRQRIDERDPELCSHSLLPTIRLHQARANECRIRMVHR